MHGRTGERTLMRIHVEEQDKFEGKPVYECVVELLRKRHFAGATVFRALEGFGASSHLHQEHWLSIREDVPLVIECIDSDAKIRDILPDLDRMVCGGIITLERVRVVIYREGRPADGTDADAELDLTEGWKPDSSSGEPHT